MVIGTPGSDASGSLQALIEHGRQEFRLPEIDGEACVYALLETASCQACVQVCPRGAWSLDDEALDIDTARCDGCGLCVPACPQGVIRHDHAPLRRHWKARALAFLACEHASGPEPEAVMPCVHALGLQDLLALYRDGFRHLVMQEVACERCPRGETRRLSEVLTQVNEMLSSRDLEEMRLRVVPGAKWQSMLSSTEVRGDGPRLGRRGFLRHALGTGIEEGLKAAGLRREHSDTHVPPGTLLPQVSAEDILPFVPLIDPLKCSGCDACMRLCPHDALTLEETDEASRYVLRARECTGCGICTDVCDHEAISVGRMGVQVQTEVALEVATCPSCRVPFHRPLAQSGPGEASCPVCATATRYQDLYQFKD